MQEKSLSFKQLKMLIKEEVSKYLLREKYSEYMDRTEQLDRIKMMNGLNSDELLEDILSALDDQEFEKILYHLKDIYAYKNI